MSLDIRIFTGAETHAVLADLARLRIAVFAEWPYLYAGDEAYEIDYLKEFSAMPDSVVVAALDHDRIVGAATASPMAGQKAEIREPVIQHGLDAAQLFYFGESVLLPQYRGKGIGHAFFDQREAAAKRYGAGAACFAAVVRPKDHPAKPNDYVPLDGFWTKRNYAKIPGLLMQLAWKDHGEQTDSSKTLIYWYRQW